MKAAVRDIYGSAEVLKVRDVEKPTPGGNELLVKVYASTVNRTDCAILTGKPYIMRLFTGALKPKFNITGTDFAGQIEAVGKGVNKFRMNDKVWGFNDLGSKSHAEYITVSEDADLTMMPEGFGYNQAAASAEGAHYAYNIINKINLKKGEKILINGSTGAIGSALVQFSKYFLADVTAVANTKNLEVIKNLGADKIVDYLTHDFTNTDKKYHYIFDAVGKSSFWKCKPLLLPGGVYISSELGKMSENPFLAMTTAIYGNKKVIFPIPFDRMKSLLFVKDLIEKGKFKPLIDKTYPLERIADAFQYVASGQKTGNVVIDLSK